MPSLEIYKVIFIIEIIIAEFLLTIHLKKRSYYPLRLIFSWVVLIAVASIYPITVNNAVSNSLMFFVLFFISVPLLMFTYDTKFINVLFCALAGYTIQHFAYEITNIVFGILMQTRSPILGMYGDDDIPWGWNLETAFLILVWILCYFTCYVILFKIYGRKIKKNKEMKIKSVTMMFLLAAGLIADIVLNSVVVYSDMSFKAMLINQIATSICCLLILYGQFTLLLNEELAGEVTLLNKLLDEQSRQYKLSKENIDMINMKCHDMRYTIRKIGRSKKLDDSIVNEMEKSISIYDSIVKTGNEALDIVLTEKSLICQKQNISLTIVANGELLNFIDTNTIYSLFGNALDNAIEACMKIDDSEKRMISLKITQFGNMINITVQNSYADDVKFDENGMPLTTKNDGRFHGFGIKSIRYLTESYNGDLTILGEDSIFTLNIIIPLPNRN